MRWVLVLAVLLAGGRAGVAGEATLETAALRFRLAEADGHFELLDKETGVLWSSNPYQARFGLATVPRPSGPERVPLQACRLQASGTSVRAVFLGTAGQAEPGVVVTIQLKDARTLEFAYEPAPGAVVESVRLLDDAFWTLGTGSVLVPVRLGMRIPADSGLAFEHRFDTYTYEGCHMAMAGVLRGGAALLLSWADPYVALEVRSTLTNALVAARGQILSPSLNLRRSARSFEVRVCGRGDWHAIAAAYRRVAAQRGWVVPWKEKLRGHPERARLFGASNYKLWSTLDRRMNEDSSKEEEVRVNWTFDEAAQVAEHLKQDLELERVLFLMGGWIHRGYDNQHPDILPAAPECGGDVGLADASRRIRQLGYLLGLHDNYQDIYRDSPSWDEALVMKGSDGKLVQGGHWAGGRAYLTCSRPALALAQRPRNLPAVRRITQADAYFIDTTYAAGLAECYDPAHPLTRGDDLHWKQALSDYARDQFGIFGSECGREWAIPHSDFFEGLTGVSGAAYHDTGLLRKLGADVVPLFELVYRDCIALYGKYGYDIHQSTEYVLSHLSIGRPLHYHNVPPHLFWTQPGAEAGRLGLRLARVEAAPKGPRALELRYVWLVDEAPRGDWRVFVHFTDASGAIQLQNDHAPTAPIAQWPAGWHTEGPFTVAIPDGLAGPLQLRAGLFREASGERALLPGPDDGERRYLLGQIKLEGGQAAFEPAAPAPGAAAIDPGQFVSGAGGWAAGMHPYDRFVKNTHELLSPLNELTAELAMTRYEFTGERGQVRHTVFGSGPARVQVWVNLGPEEYRAETSFGEAVLAGGGFVVDSPAWVAFCARRWNGFAYELPTFFTLRARDGKPLSRSRDVTIFHGFGDPRLRWGKALVQVPRGARLDPKRMKNVR